jgi:phospholipid N-methyltransferase
VFVFISEKDFQTTYPTLLEHARRYNVYAMSLARLSEVVGSAYTKDLSIINASDSKLLAVYDDGLPEQKNICFIAETRTIDDYEKQFDKLLKSNGAVHISNKAGNEIADIEQFMNRLFRDLEFYETRLIEMSGYINVSDYDEHEEKHAYYQQMMQRMIGICLDHRRSHPKPSFDVLELGAGTGIFTKRLLTELPNITKIDIIEIDWQCYGILEGKLKKYASLNQIEINIHHEDSRTYDPPGKFDYIFSSFADHHIKTGDKEKYFENVKRNLKPDGLLLVGDEFIREHDSKNKNERYDALRVYHNHIIELAEQEGESVLAGLERAALQSGLEEKGDFKISCTQYERHLREAGFDFNPPEKIGPLDQDDIGGIYVYTASLRS